MNKIKIKVLHIVTSGRIGGAERSVEWIAQEVDLEQFNHEFVFLFGGGTIESEIKKRGFVTHILNWTNGYSFSGRIKLLQLIASRRPDIIHSQDTTPLVKIFIKLFFLKTPVIYTCHGILSNSFVAKLGQLVDDKFIDLVIANSDYTLFIYRMIHHRTAPIIRIYLGLNLDKYRSEVWADPKTYPANNSSCEILYLGRLQDYKGVLDLPEVASELIKLGFENFTINVVGDGPCQDRMLNMIRLRDVEKHFVLWGEQEHVIPYLVKTDILLFPSLWEEPFGLVLLEAIACGLSIVAYDSGAVREVLGNAPGAVIVEKANTKKMADAIVDIALDNKYPFLGDCINYIDQNFNIHQTVLEIESAYKSVLKAS